MTIDSASIHVRSLCRRRQGVLFPPPRRAALLDRRRHRRRRFEQGELLQCKVAAAAKETKNERTSTSERSRSGFADDSHDANVTCYPGEIPLRFEED